jgi:Rhodopirellula transposase DDE domain
MPPSTTSKKDQQALEAGNVKRLSRDCKATVAIGEFSRGGLTRGDTKACDHDFGCQENYHPGGIVDEDTGQLAVTFGSSFKTSDFIVDTLSAWWTGLRAQEQAATALVQIKMDNGPESSGIRTQFLNPMVQFADQIGKPIQLLLLSVLPRAKYNPMKRCWGILELHWNGTHLIDVQTMLAWAQSMTWKGIHSHSRVELSRKLYQKGVSQGGNARGGSALRARSTVTQVGHSDSPGDGSLVRDVLFEKSPYHRRRGTLERLARFSTQGGEV